MRPGLAHVKRSVYHDEVSRGPDSSQGRAKAKNDACGIGSRETRHPRWERCAAPMGAGARPVCFQVFSGIAALGSAAPFPW
jgi:hypothetical protein